MAVQLFTGAATLSSATARFAVSALTPCSIMAWVRANDSTVWNARVSMFGVYGPAAPTTALQMGCTSTNTFGCWTWGGANMVNAIAPYSVPTGTWNHYAVTYDGTTFRLYIDGVLNNTATTAQQAGTLGQTYINGFPTGGTSETGNFSVDDFMFFNRALSQDEVRTIVMAEGPRDGIVQGLLARYTFEEGPVGAAVVAGVDLTPSAATMTPAGTGTTPLYYAPRATSNVRQYQG